MKQLTILMIAYLSYTLGCSDAAPETMPAAVVDLDELVGRKCTADETCGRLGSEGFCSNVVRNGSGAPSNTCTATCATHTDCGCPPGTTSGDIALGKCGAACIENLDGTKHSVCVRVCQPGECNYVPDARCSAVGFGYKACVKDSQVR